jgi:hypothetical protein
MSGYERFTDESQSSGTSDVVSLVIKLVFVLILVALGLAIWGIYEMVNSRDQILGLFDTVKVPFSHGVGEFCQVSDDCMYSPNDPRKTADQTGLAQFKAECIMMKCTDATGKVRDNEPCVLGQPQCNDGSYCSSPSSTCLPKKGSGEGCSIDEECLHGCLLDGVQKCKNEFGYLDEGTYCLAGTTQCGPGPKDPNFNDESLVCVGRGMPVEVACRKRGIAGDYCPLDDKYCMSDHFCNGGSQCEAKRELGEACTLGNHSACKSDRCGDNSQCINNDGTVSENHDCTIGSGPSCASGLLCVGRMKSGILRVQCHQKGDVGDYCPLDGSFCKAGLICTSGSVCSEPKKENEWCAAGECAAGLSCGADLHCKVAGKTGSYCPLDSSKCAPGYFCDAASTCQALKNEGEPCAAGQCVAGLSCGSDLHCKRAGQTGAYCPLDHSKCASGYFCDADSTCREKRNAGDVCILGQGLQFCKSGVCEWNWGKARAECK